MKKLYPKSANVIGAFLLIAIILIAVFKTNDHNHANNSEIQSKNSIDKSEHQYFIGTPNGKITFIYDNSSILIAFEDSMTNHMIMNWFKDWPILKPYNENNVIDSPRSIIAYLQEEIPIDSLSILIKSISEDHKVRFCSPYLIGSDHSTRTFENKFFVKLRQKDQKSELNEILRTYNIKQTYQYEKNELIYIVEVDKNSLLNAFEIASKIENMELFDFASPNFITQLKLFTNDTYFNNQWAIKNDGSSKQGGGTPDADMDIDNAWGITMGSPTIRIAIIDCGVDVGNEDLDGTYSGYGYDATGLGSGGLPNYSILNNAHGTGCAGIICAEANNGIGIAGIAPNCRYVAVRVATTTINGKFTNSSSLIQSDGIYWAWQTAKADILSNSWGGGGYDSMIEIAINDAVTKGRNGKGCLVFFSTGNDGSSVSYPASSPNVIAVGATTNTDKMASFSNHGSNLDISASGEHIYTTDVSGVAGNNLLGDYYDDFSGTSAACPMAAGVMGLVLSINPDLTSNQARHILESTCDKVGSYTYNSNISGQPNGTWSNQLGYGRINGYKAVLATGEPDLVPLSQSLSPISIQAGSNITVKCAEQNLGSVAAGANVISIHLSTDEKFDNGVDRYIGEIPVSGVAVNSYTSILSQTVKIPSDVSAGNYFVIFSADGGGVIDELLEDDDNNRATASLTVTSASTSGNPTINTPSPSSLAFSNVTVNETSTKNFTVSGSDLTGSVSVSVSGSGFTISKSETSGFSTNSLSFSPSGGTLSSQKGYVRFSPTSAGSKTGSISVTSSGANTKTVSLSGTGVTSGSAPSNDNSSSPKSLAIYTSCSYESYTTINATPPGTDIPFYGSSTCTSLYKSTRYDDDVWFYIQPTTTNPVTISVNPTSNLSNFDIVLGLYNSTLSQITCGAKGDVGELESITFTPQANTGYLIRVFSYGEGSSYSGNFDICVTSSGGNADNDCDITILEAPSDGSIYSDNGTDDYIAIEGKPNCALTVSKSCSWVTITSMNSKIQSNGQAFIDFYLDENSSGEPRICTININGKSVTIRQGEIDQEDCTSPSVNVDDKSGSSSVIMTCTASGGSGGSYMYKWYNGSTCSGQVIGTASTLSVNSSGNYSCKVYIDGYESTCNSYDYGYANLNSSEEKTICSWNKKSDMPIARYTSASATYGNYIYIFGGNYGPSFYQYDVINDNYITKTPMSGGTDESQAAVLGNKIYLCHGFSDEKVRVYDTSSDIWETKSERPIGDFGRGAVFKAVGNYLYAFGGGDGNLSPTSQIDKYNPSNDSWTTLNTSMPTARCFASAVVYNNLIYIIGGRTSSSISTIVEVFDPSSNSWTTKSPMPQKRSGAIAELVNNKIYVIGGFNGSTYTNTIQEYNLTTDSWSIINLSPTLLNFADASSGVVNDKIYIMGGDNSSGPISSTEEFVLCPVINYTISTSSYPTEGGSTSGSGNYPNGKSITVAATANSGHTFSNWSENGTSVSTNANYTFTVSGNRSLVANFTQNAVNYTISTSSNPSVGGSTSGSGSYSNGQSLTVTATPNNGYSFLYWSENGTSVSTNANYTFTVSGNRSLVANFTQNAVNYTISTSSNTSAGGSTSGSGSFSNGQSLTVTATANNGYSFSYWSENGTSVSTNANYTFTVSGNRSLVANFTQNAVNYTISTSSNPSVGGSTSGSGSYSNGQSLTVTASSNSGYIFSYWSENGVSVSTNASYTFAISGNRNLVANFITSPNNGKTVTDIDGNVYSTVTIGSQVWLGQNLKTTKYNDGTSIPLVTDNNTWSTFLTPAYSWYNNDIGYKNPYGALYNWYSVNTRKLCPTGWHVPTNTEWTELTNYLGGENTAGGKLKETGSIRWSYPNIGATNESNFTGLPSGNRNYISANFYGFGISSLWWSNTENGNDNAWFRVIYFDGGYIQRLDASKSYGFSVRCLCDALTSSTDELSNTIKMVMYPNPTKDIVNISLGQPFEGDFQIDVYNNIGLLIQSKKVSLSSSNTQIDLAGYTPGIYLIKICTKNISFVGKILKQ